MIQESPVLSNVADHVLVLTLNRPHVKNAVNAAMAAAVSRMLDEFEANDDLRVAVITGAKGTFCSGMDLRAFAAGESPRTCAKSQTLRNASSSGDKLDGRTGTGWICSSGCWHGRTKTAAMRCVTWRQRPRTSLL